MKHLASCKVELIDSMEEAPETALEDCKGIEEDELQKGLRRGMKKKLLL